jgi:hypothetical protein
MENLSREEILQNYKSITDFIILNYSKLDSLKRTTLQEEYVKDIAFLNQILGRMENYLLDKNDTENFDLMVLYFQREFEDRFYSWDYFNEHIETLNDNENE